MGAGKPSGKRIAAALSVAVATGLVAVADAAPGDLDPAFGDAGRVTTSFEPGGSDWARALAIQLDGKIVAGGPSSGPATGWNPRFGLARYNSDGTLDEGFGASGRVRTNFGFRPPPSENQETTDNLEGLTIQPDGKIVAVGGTDDGLTDFAIARYDPSGSLDPTFGAGGLAQVDMNAGRAFDVALTDDGKILVAGDRHGGSSARRFGLLRLNPNGTLDETFGVDGIAEADFPGGQAGARALALDPGPGDIVLAGFARPIASSDFALARFDAEGSLDPSFGNDGILTTEFPALGPDEAFDVAVLPGGEILAGGSAAREAGGGRGFALARYLSDGSLDTSFGTGGRATSGFRAGDEVAFDIAPGGSIAMLGTAVDSDGDTRELALARYGPDGSPDPSFGQDGWLTTPFGDPPARGSGYALARQADGKLVAGGRVSVVSDTGSFALARYESGAPRLRVQGLPKRRTVGSRAGKAAFRFQAGNVGDAPTGRVRLCVRAPKQRVAVVGRPCAVHESVPAGKTRRRQVRLKVKRAARGKVTAIRLIARGANVQNRQTVVRLRVKG